MSAKAANATQASTASKPRPTLAQQASVSDVNDGFIRTKILLVGLRRSGKTSIQQVLFEDLSPKQAFFVEPTTRLMKHRVDSFIPLEIWDCPGTVTVETLGVPLSIFTTIIFVIDIQDSYHNPIARLIDFFVTAFQESPEINLEVFVHKAESMTEEYRTESYRLIQTRLMEELSDLPLLSINGASPAGPSFEAQQIPYMFHLTSVYDHSLQEAFARVFTRILAPGSLPFLEELLNAFISTSSSDKAFLFDTKAKFFVATDSSPVDAVTFGLCCDYVHMLNQFGSLYKSAITSPSTHPRRSEVVPSPQSQSPYSTPSDVSLPSSPKSAKSRPEQSSQNASASASRSPTPTHTGSTNSSDPKAPTSSPSFSRSRSSTTAKPIVSEENAETSKNTNTNRKKALFHPSSAASLTPHDTLVFHSVTPRLALVARLPTTVWETKRGLVEYNIVYFREGVQEIYELEQDTRRKKKRHTGGSTQSTLSKVSSKK